MHGIDVETTALTPEEGKLRLVQVSDGEETDVYDAFRQDAEVIRRAVEREEGLVAHNAVFERAWLNAALAVDRPDLHDTMIMSQVYYTGTRAALSKSFSHSLAAVVKRELKRELSKDEQVSDWEAAALTREQLEYAALDAKMLPGLAATLMRKIERAGLQKVYELELRVSHAIDAMQRRGVAIHTDRLDEMTAEATERAERLKAELAEEWGINPGSSKQLREHFSLDERKGWPKTDGGSPSTNQEAMKALLAEEESVAKWLEWKEVEKIRSTYGESLRKRLTPEGRIHARFNPFGTATGRFSSSGPNLQNIPKRGEFGKRMRGLFWSGSDDRVLIKADYASIELSVGGGRAVGGPLHAEGAPVGRQHARRDGRRGAVQCLKPGEALRSKIRRRIKRFPGLDQALKAPLRDTPNTPCWGVASQGCGFKVFSGGSRQRSVNVSRCTLPTHTPFVPFTEVRGTSFLGSPFAGCCLAPALCDRVSYVECRRFIAQRT